MTAGPGTARFIPRPALFWTGTLLTCAGVAEHLWEFIQAAPMHFQMAMMPMSPLMWAAMAAIVVGVIAAGYALKPVPDPTADAPVAHPPVSRKKLVGILSFALLVDQMKPATLAFIEPGMRAEYHLTQAQVAWFPTVALTGTVLGSLAWGRAADRIGRRATILTASLLFLGTTVCGAMTSFTGNLIMCGLMGVAAGGMLPVVYALMTETLPTDRRTGIMVLQAGLTSTGGYMAASGLAALLLPLAGWRVLWFAQLPLVLILLGLNHWIPESAAFAATRARIVPAPASTLLRRPHTTTTLVLTLYALAWGLIYWGFVTFLPTVLATSHAHGMSAPTLLFLSSLLSIPTCGVAAWLSARWSARATMVVYAGVTVGALAALAILGPAGPSVGIVVVVVALLAGCAGVIALLGPYTAQLYPTAIRGTAGGWAAAASKSGGAFGPPLVALLLSAPGGARTAALAVAVPMVAGACAVALRRSAPTAAHRLDALETELEALALTTPHPARQG